RSVNPSGPVERPLVGSRITIPLALMRMRSPRFTISPVLVQSRLPTTSTVTVLTGPVGLRLKRSPSELSDAGTVGTGAGVAGFSILSGLSVTAGSGSLAGGEAGCDSGGPTSRGCDSTDWGLTG